MLSACKIEQCVDENVGGAGGSIWEWHEGQRPENWGVNQGYWSIAIITDKQCRGEIKI